MILSELKQILGVKSITFGQLPKRDGSGNTVHFAAINGVTLFVTKKSPINTIKDNSPVTNIDGKWFVGVVENKLVNTVTV